MLMTKSIYALPGPCDGSRVLVTRFWPRGVRRDLVSEWRRELAPSAPLLKKYKCAKIPWNEFAAAYWEEMDSDAGRLAIADLRSRSMSSNVTLLCYEPDGAHCHRHILRRMILASNRRAPGVPIRTNAIRCHRPDGSGRPDFSSDP